MAFHQLHSSSPSTDSTVPERAVVGGVDRRGTVPPGHVQVRVPDGLVEHDGQLGRVAVGPNRVVAHAADGHLPGLGPPVHEQRCCLRFPLRFVSFVPFGLFRFVHFVAFRVRQKKQKKRVHIEDMCWTRFTATQMWGDMMPRARRPVQVIDWLMSQGPFRTISDCKIRSKVRPDDRLCQERSVHDSFQDQRGGLRDLGGGA